MIGTSRSAGHPVSVDFEAAIQVHGPLAVAVIAKRLDGQRQQRRFLFGEHRGELPLGGAVNARVGPALLPAIQIRLCLFQALEVLTLQRRLLGVTDAALDFALGAGCQMHRVRAVLTGVSA